MHSTNSNNDNNHDEDWDGIGDVQKFNDKITSDNDDTISDDNNKEITFSIDNKSDPSSYPTSRKFVGGSSLFSSPITTEQPSSLSLSSSSSSRNTKQPNDQVYVVDEREINLVSVFEQTLPIQVLALFAAICFTVYIGFTGGITDGSDRYNNDFIENDIDGTILLVEPETLDYLNNNNNDQNDDISPSVFI